MAKKQIVSNLLETLFNYKKVSPEAQTAIIRFSKEGWEHGEHAKTLAATLFDSGMRAANFKSDNDAYDVDMVNEVRELIARGMPDDMFKSVTMAIALLPTLAQSGPDKEKRQRGMKHIARELGMLVSSLALFEEQASKANSAKQQDEYVEVILYAMLDQLVSFVSGTKAEQWPNGCQPKMMMLISEVNEACHAVGGKQRAPRTAKYKK